uniref:Uncharacterized protein n=1 Tax=Panagrolaimus davidi TaxID=227884 RepID=A0A914PCU5_9BILA
MFTGFIGQNHYIFYQIPIDPITGSTFKLHMNDGSAEFYLSQTSRLSSSVDYANSATETPGQIFVSPENFHTATENSVSTIHIALVGISPKNTFQFCNEKHNTIQILTTTTTPTNTTTPQPPHLADVKVHVLVNYYHP